MDIDSSDDTGYEEYIAENPGMDAYESVDYDFVQDASNPGMHPAVLDYLAFSLATTTPRVMSRDVVEAILFDIASNPSTPSHALGMLAVGGPSDRVCAAALANPNTLESDVSTWERYGVSVDFDTRRQHAMTWLAEHPAGAEAEAEVKAEAEDDSIHM